MRLGSLGSVCTLFYVIFAEVGAIRIWQGQLQRKQTHASANRSFVIDGPNNRFLKDGQPFEIIGVHVHYYTIAPDLWFNRLKTARAMGANTVGVYVPWNLHEPEQGQFNWVGIADLERFLKTASKLGLLVNLRPAPCIDSEWEAGGHPAWLLKDPTIKLRHSDPLYANALKNWYDVLLPKLAPHTYENGGPIIMAQVENEYGGWSCEDKPYLEFIRDSLQSHLGPNVILYTTDFHATYYMQCGGVDGVFKTGDFGTDSYDGVKGSYEAQKECDPQGGPFVNSEFYPAWFDSWGDSGHHTGSPSDVVGTIESIWAFNGSFTLYMGVGGTFWGYTNGAYGDANSYSPVTTSYDYDAPVSEAGDPTPKFLAVREAVEKHIGAPVPYPIPKPPAKANYGKVKLTKIGTFLDLLDTLSPSSTAVMKQYPVNVEQLSLPFYYGFVLYESEAPVDGSEMTVTAMADRAYVIANGEVIIVLQRQKIAQPSFQYDIRKGDKILILVENQGRICHDYLFDPKGLLGNVTIDTTIVENWAHYPVNISALTEALGDPQRAMPLLRQREKRQAQVTNGLSLPAFYAGEIDLPNIVDTFLNPTNWTKGQAFVNGVNIGRYWPQKGPQITLYLPAPYLQAKTKILLFELDGPGNCEDDDRSTCYIELVDHMIYS